MTVIVSFFLIAIVLSAALCLLLRRTADRLHLVCTPRADRWHRRAVPLGGGIALFAATVMSASFSFAFEGTPDLKTIGLVMLSVMVFGVGLSDDRYGLKPMVKLLWMCLAAATLVLIGHVFAATSSPAANMAITFFWLIGITNAMNLLDNMDGLAGGIAFIALFFRVITFGTTAPGVLLCFALMGALAGFLLFNLPAASIFMGDAGSLFLGFTVGALLIPPSSAYSPALSTLVAPVFILLIPIFDTCVVIFSRLLSGISIFKGGCDHVSHRLVAGGLAEHKAVLVLYSLAFLSGTVGLVHYKGNFSAAAMVGIVALGAMMILLTLYLQRVGQLGIEPLHEGRKHYRRQSPPIGISSD